MIMSNQWLIFLAGYKQEILLYQNKLNFYIWCIFGKAFCDDKSFWKIKL